MSGPSTEDLLVSEMKTALETLRGRPVNVSNAPDAEDLRSPSEFVAAIEAAGPPGDLSAIIWSYGDTLSDEEVLSALVDWNDFGREAQQIVAE